jgi:MYXO-CTERM domain-containing protein
MRSIPVFLALAALLPAPAFAASSTQAPETPMHGNGHNVSFDGRLFIAKRGGDNASGGWFALVFRPEGVALDGDGFPDMTQGAFSAPSHIQVYEAGENALAMCETDPDNTPFACDEAGNASGAGPYDCYDLWVIDSNAYPDQHNNFRRRRLKLWVASPDTANASVHKHQWFGAREPLAGTGGAELRGIEPTVTRDGKLLLWQGHHDNDGRIDLLVYATNDNPCAATGWDGPHPLAHMVNDPKAAAYPLAERQLRAADGDLFEDERELFGGLYTEDADQFHGAYPWLFPDGDAVIFTSIVVPCRSENDPVGCGPRRGGIAVIGYPTNWGLAHVDGAVNPMTDDQVRLFFSSPGPVQFDSIPVTEGIDVWPFFGSNTRNYTEISFDDGLDGQYAGVWLMNESVDKGGDIDRGRTPDTSGYFNTGVVHGGVFPAANSGPVGKVLELNGVDAWVEVPHSVSLEPVNAITVEAWLRPDSAADCGAGNNWRALVDKGGLDGAYGLVLEEDMTLKARVRVDGQTLELHSTQSVPVGQWSKVAFTWRGWPGDMSFWIDGVETARQTVGTGTLDGSGATLALGGPGVTRPACADGNGYFHGALEEVRVSRVDRYSPAAPPMPMTDGGSPDADAGTVSPGDDAGSTSPGDDAGPTSPNADAGTPGPAYDAGPGPVILDDNDDGSGGDEPAAECACATPRDGAPWLALGLLALFGARARPRRRTAR